MKEYGVTYARIALPRGHKLEWLRHCYLTDVLPKYIQEAIKEISEKINNEFKNDIIVPMDNRLNPGCTTTQESIEKIATAIYEGLTVVFGEIDQPCIRCVYSIGEIDEEHLKNCTSTHEIGTFPVMVKLGRYLDSSEEPGIFKI